MLTAMCRARAAISASSVMRTSCCVSTRLPTHSSVTTVPRVACGQLLNTTASSAPTRQYSVTIPTLGGRHSTTQPDRVVHWQRHISKKAKKRYKHNRERQVARTQMQQKQQAAMLGIKNDRPQQPLPSPSELAEMSKANRRILESLATPEPAPPSNKQALLQVDANALLGAMKAGYIESSRQNYNYALRVLGAHGRLEDAMRLFSEMNRAGIAPTSNTFTALISACAEQRNIDAAYKVFQHQREITALTAAKVLAETPLLEGGSAGSSETDSKTAILPFESNAQHVPLGELVKSKVPAGVLPHVTQQVLRKSIAESKLAPSDATYGALMQTHIRSFDLDGAFKVLSMAEADGIKLNTIHFTHLIVGSVQMGQYDRAWDVFKHMRRYHGEPDVVTFTALINACAKTDQVEKALNLHQEMKQMGLQPTNVTFNALIHTAGRSFRRHNLAHDLFHEMAASGFQHDESSFNAVILACSHTGDVARARQYVSQMFAEGVKPTLVTYNTLLAVYARAMKSAHAVTYQPDRTLTLAEGKELLQLEEQSTPEPARTRAVGDYARRVEGDVNSLVENLLADYYQDDKEPRVDPEEEKATKLFESDDVKDLLPAVEKFNQDLADPEYNQAKEYLAKQGIDKSLVASFEAENEQYPAVDTDDESARLSRDMKDEREWQLQAEAKALELVRGDIGIERKELSLARKNARMQAVPASSLTNLTEGATNALLDGPLGDTPAMQRLVSGRLLFDEFIQGTNDATATTSLATVKKLSFQDFMKDLESGVEQELFGDGDRAAPSLFDSDGEIGGQKLEDLMDIRNIPLPPTSDSDGEHDPVKLHDYYAKVVAERVSAALDEEFGGDDEDVIAEIEESLLTGSPMRQVIDVQPVPSKQLVGTSTIVDADAATHNDALRTVTDGLPAATQISETVTLASTIDSSVAPVNSAGPDCAVETNADAPPPPGMVRRRRSMKASPPAAEVSAAGAPLQELLIAPQDTPETFLRHAIRTQTEDIDVAQLLSSPDERRRIHGRVLSKLLRRAIVPAIDSAIVAAVDSPETKEYRETLGRKPKLTDLVFAVQALKSNERAEDTKLGVLLDKENSRPAKRFAGLVNVSETILSGAAWLPPDYPAHTGARRAQQLKEAELVYINEYSKNGLSPDPVTLNTMVALYCFAGKESKAYSFLENEFAKHGIRPDVRTFRPILTMHVKGHATAKAEKVFESMKALAVAPDKDCYGLLVHAYARDWRLKDAINVLKTMKADGMECSEHFACLLRQRCKEAGIVHSDVPAHPVAWQFTPAIRAKRRAHSKVINKLANLALRPRLRNGWR